LSALTAVSPIDGRYANSTRELRDVFSEMALMRYRIKVELKWLQALADSPDISEVPALSVRMIDYLDHIVESFNVEEAEKVKKIEATTNHDVKAIEYYLKNIVRFLSMMSSKQLMHFIW
jgi:adenylosuccinate lyase